MRFARWITLVAIAAGLTACSSREATPASTSVAPSIDFVEGDAVPSGKDLALLAAPIRYSDFASQVVYFVMPDRYANGDPSNDEGNLSGSRNVTGFDPTDIGFFHGGDLRGLMGECNDPAEGLKRLQQLGFTAIWVTPLVVQRTVQGDSAAYHGYWGIDFTTVDPHLGTEEDFTRFVDCAHSLDMRVYMDVVVNHTGDVVKPVGGTQFVEPPEPAYEPYVLPPDANVKKPEWMNDVSNYHNRGDIDWGGCSQTCYEQGDFSGLDDLFTEKPEVVNGLADAFASWITRFKIDGFRVDTARHVDKDFYHRWIPKIMDAAKASGVDHFEIFGEVFLTDSIEQSTYVRDWGLPNLLDFPLYEATADYAGGSLGGGGIAIRLADDDYVRTGNLLAPTPGTFIGNHDIGRTAFVIKSRSGAEDEALLEQVNLGHSVLYLTRGAPIVYYGDEFGLIGSGGDKEARQDLFPTQVSDWQTQSRVGAPPVGEGSSFDDKENPVGRHLADLGALRKKYPVLARGATLVRNFDGSALVVSRFDFDDQREYLTLFNNSADPITVTTSVSTPNSTFKTVYGKAKADKSTGTAEITLTIPAMSASVIRANDTFPLDVSAPTVEVTRDDYSNLIKFSASTSASPQQVTFIVNKGKGWERVGTDDAADYASYLSDAALGSTKRFKVAAVSRFADGTIVVSDVIDTEVPPSL